MTRATTALRSAAPLIALALLAGCGTDPEEDSTVAAPAAPGRSDDALVLRVERTGGLVTPSMQASRLPMFSLYGDGRVLTLGPMELPYPMPALPNILEGRLDREQVDGLVQQALDAGVGRDVDLGTPPLADAAATRFTVVTDEGTQQLEVYALDEEVDTSALTPEQQEARSALRALSTTLLDLGVSADQPYEPTAVAAVVSPYVDPAEKSLAQKGVAWPGPALPGDDYDESLGVGCVTATREKADEVLEAARAANTLTPWTYADARWAVAFRPLLPDEAGCDDLS